MITRDHCVILSLISFFLFGDHRKLSDALILRNQIFFIMQLFINTIQKCLVKGSRYRIKIQG